MYVHVHVRILHVHACIIYTVCLYTSLLQYFTVCPVLGGFQWTVLRTYQQFVDLHKVVSPFLYLYLHV